MNTGELIGAGVVLFVVGSQVLGAMKRGAKGNTNARRSAIERIAEKSGGSTDLRALLNAARQVAETAAVSVSEGSTAVDLGEILAAAREIKTAHPHGGATVIDARALLEAAKAFKAQAQEPAATHAKHKKKHQQQFVPVAQFNGARPALGALPAFPPLHKLHPMQAHAEMRPLPPIAAL